MIITAGGMMFATRPDSVADPAVIREMFDENVYQLHPHDLGHTGLLVDLGANIGAVTAWAANLNRTEDRHIRVLAVEPQRENRALLERNLSGNGLTEWVTVVPEAIGESAGTALISDEHGGSRLGDTGDTVTVVSLDTLLADIPEVDVLKIDTEGAEYPIVRGAQTATLAKARYIVMEYHQTKDRTFGMMVAKLAHTHNLHTFGSPRESGGMLYGRRY